MASNQNYGFPYLSPPPPRPIAPPPPHIVPTPPAPPPGHHTTIIIVFVSLGVIFFLAFLFVALCCFIKKKKKMVRETEVINVDQHLKVKEAIAPGPNGTQAVTLSIDEDFHIQEEIKNEKIGESLHAKPTEFRAASSGSSHHPIEQKH